MTGKKLKVVILAGGPSSEHEVSLKTAGNVVAKLDKKKYDVEQIIISKNGEWPILPDKLAADVVFIAMHGAYGEDGTVQSILEKANIPYTGSDAVASKLGMDKRKSSEIFSSNGLLVPESFDVSRCKFPVVIKPADGGSSVGVAIVETADKLQEAIKEASKHSSEILAQEYIEGRELTCGVLDDGLGNVTALPPTEIIPVARKFFDYQAKYIAGASREVTPPDLSEKIIKTIQEIALKAHKIIGCSGMSRTDVIIKNSDPSKIYVLEINTIPGLTETSLLPQEALAAGISFSELLDRIIIAALNRFKRRK
ncbi:MAG: D-alanine--D-alanine ligase [Patescibacteria group bacterium]